MQTPQFLKRGLLIGINYTGTSNVLNGCINDTLHLKQFLTNKNYFRDGDLLFMNDHQSGYLRPTKENIILQLNELVRFTNSNADKKVYLFVCYSGHGSYISDKNGDEPDGRDEMLCPVDCDSNGFIVDDYMRTEFIDKFGSNTTLVFIIDACHSGSMLDLKYTYSIDKRNSHSALGHAPETKCNVIMISGCMDFQTSADILYDNKYQGAMTASFIATYKDGITYKELIENMRLWLRTNKYCQIPQLSSGRLIDVTKPCLLSAYDDVL